MRLSWWLSGKEFMYNARDTGDAGSIPGSEGKATNSSILARKVLWTGGLQSRGSQSIKRDRACMQHHMTGAP